VPNFVEIARTEAVILRFFRFFKMAAAAMSDFKKIKFITVKTVKKVEVHQCANFCRNCSNRGRDMVIFRFLRLRPPPSWILKISDF